ncbi:hypothetical protein [Paraburkholderia fungorum]|uniref:hypothetical protein n=1 Tax=Paraburkholderia fungorum TaxID=134537 RepID=UPI0004AB08D7|nr:hypothetical protein [Paraburkholderia fungorum]KFX60643.1 hypothetical protein KBK24_0137065 [Burkholderia sp. K24]USX10601.1 hypothetical protein NHH62_28710 [Paraburkholderia fungorum]
MSKVFDVVHAEALRVLGLLDDQGLIEMASRALLEGDRRDAVVQLAICTSDEAGEIRKLFGQILLEVGVEGMLTIDALRHYAKRISESILTGSVSPVDGAKAIWRASLGANLIDFHEVDSFIYAASEADDRPWERDFFERAIVDEAKRWCNP